MKETDIMLGRMIQVIAAVALMGAAPATRQTNWNGVVSRTAEGGYLAGNPDAKVKLVEYVSYTCPHCAHFEAEAEGPLRLTFIARGTGSFEVRPLIRNKIDIAVTLLATCGPVARFRGNHTAFLRGQDRWLQNVSPASEQRWSSSDFPTAMRAIASDLKLYEFMQNRGYNRPELDRCLADRTAADKLAAQTRYAIDEVKVRGTPSFIVNGELLDASDWEGLRPLLMELTR